MDEKRVMELFKRTLTWNEIMKEKRFQLEYMRLKKEHEKDDEEIKRVLQGRIEELVRSREMKSNLNTSSEGRHQEISMEEQVDHFRHVRMAQELERLNTMDMWDEKELLGNEHIARAILEKDLKDQDESIKTRIKDYKRQIEKEVELIQELESYIQEEQTEKDTEANYLQSVDFVSTYISSHANIDSVSMTTFLKVLIENAVKENAWIQSGSWPKDLIQIFLDSHIIIMNDQNEIQLNPEYVHMLDRN